MSRRVKVLLQRMFVACYRFVQLIPMYCINNAGQFKVFCDDMQPSNMLINPDTLYITTLLDFEFANTILTKFVYNLS